MILAGGRHHRGQTRRATRSNFVAVSSSALPWPHPSLASLAIPSTELPAPTCSPKRPRRSASPSDQAEKALYADLERPTFSGAIEPLGRRRTSPPLQSRARPSRADRATSLTITMAPGDPARYRQLFFASSSSIA